MEVGGEKWQAIELSKENKPSLKGTLLTCSELCVLAESFLGSTGFIKLFAGRLTIAANTKHFLCAMTVLNALMTLAR